MLFLYSLVIVCWFIVIVSFTKIYKGHTTIRYYLKLQLTKTTLLAHADQGYTYTGYKAQEHFVNEDMVFRVRCAEQTVRDTQERVRTTCRQKIQISSRSKTSCIWCACSCSESTQKGYLVNPLVEYARDNRCI